MTDCIIQARMGYTKLSCKVLLKIEKNKTVLDFIVE